MHSNVMKPLPDININTYYNRQTNKSGKSQPSFNFQNSEKDNFKETIMKRKKMETFHKNETIQKKYEFSASLKKNNIITNPSERIAM